MGQRYIGSKTKIKDVIVSEIQKFVPENGTVVDIMCGFGSISGELRKKNYKVIAVDVMNQACHVTKVKMLLTKPPLFKDVKKFMRSNQFYVVSQKTEVDKDIYLDNADHSFTLRNDN